MQIIPARRNGYYLFILFPVAGCNKTKTRFVTIISPTAKPPVMKKLLAFILAFAITTQLTAQQPFKRTTLYGEIGGNGLGFSAGYERQLGKKPGLGLHIGISLSGNKPGIVTGAKYLIALGNHKSFLETGLGVSLADREYLGAKQDLVTGHNPYTPAYIPSVGYRHHTRYGLMWRINYTPVFSKYNNVPWYPGISVGWRF